MKNKIKYLLFKSLANYIAAILIILPSGLIAYFIFGQGFSLYYIHLIGVSFIITKLIYSMLVYSYYSLRVKSIYIPDFMLDLGVDKETIIEMYIEKKAKDAL